MDKRLISKEAFKIQELCTKSIHMKQTGRYFLLKTTRQFLSIPFHYYVWFAAVTDLNKVVAHLAGASLPGLCRVKRYRFEPRTTHYFLPYSVSVRSLLFLRTVQ